MAQVAVVYGGHILERGAVTRHNAAVPAVTAGQCQVIDLGTTYTGTPLLDSEAWWILQSSDADSARNRNWRLWRPGPRPAAVVQISYAGAAAVTVGVGYGVTGLPESWSRNAATQGTSSDAVPTTPVVNTKLESLTICSAVSGMWPRQLTIPGAVSILPTASSSPPQDWTYTSVGGIGMGVRAIVTNHSTPAWQPPAWTASNPDGAENGLSDFWRLITTNFVPPPAVVVQTPAISVDARSGFVLAPGLQASSTSPTTIAVSVTHPEPTDITQYEVFASTIGSVQRVNPKTIPGGATRSIVLTDLLPGINYVVSARAVRMAGGQNETTVWSAMTEQVVRTQGVSIMPANVGAMPTGPRTAVVSFELAYQPGVSVQVWVGPVAGSMQLAGTMISGNVYNLTGLQPATDYQVQVRAMTGSVEGELSAPVTFTTPTGPVTPTEPGGDRSASRRVRRNLKIMDHC